MKINAKDLHYKDLNKQIKKAVSSGEKEIRLANVNGQRYIGSGIKEEASIEISGVPGNDLAAFMDGPTILSYSNAQDAVGNTMNSGKIVIHGHAGDIVGYSMRGGKIFIKDDVGYRVGIHMKSYKESHPVVIVGGTARDFLGEYMAGGLLIVLGLNEKKSEIVGNHVGTGMHGGTIYVRGELEDHQLGREIGVIDIDDEDMRRLRVYLKEYANEFDLDLHEIMEKRFTKLVPQTHRPYGKLYAY